MAHFNFENMLSEVTRMDAPIQNGPVSRWERKTAEANLNIPAGGPLSPWKPKSAKTPSKTPKTPFTGKTTKTPSKTPGKSQKHPSKTPSKTPAKQQGQQDRFIPNRSTTDKDLGYYALMKENDEALTPSKIPYAQQLNDALNKGQNPQDAKILSFQEKAPKAQDGHTNNLKVLYSTGKVMAPKATSTRQIPQQPDRILDAPDLLDDYYLNLLDWSVNNHLAVALGGAVYLWNANSGTITQLLEMQSTDDYVSCVSWVKEGNILAVGTNTGNVQLWDAGSQKLMRTMSGHASRVGSLAWNAHIVTSGCRSGSIHHHDVRVASHHNGTLSSHTQEVCGLAWSPDGRYLASGGNDNILNIWDTTLALEDVQPVHTFTHHQAAVKALGWCPWNPQLLASGGGTADRHIRLWNVASGTCVSAVDTSSQVCSILWSKEHKELISGHGYSQNQLIIWKYPQMTRVAELTGHVARVLCLTMSPDGTTVASAAADETIRLWKCFASIDKVKKGSVSKPSKDLPGLSMMRSSIR